MIVTAGMVDRFLVGAGSIDWSQALARLKSGDFDQEVLLAEDIAGIAAGLGVPYAAWVEDGLEVLQLIKRAKDLGYWAPAQPEDPVMAHKNVKGVRSEPHINLPPGYDPMDPLGYDRRDK